MNIVCSTDNNFVQHCSIMLTSVLVNNNDVVVWLLSEGLTDKNLNLLTFEVKSKGGILRYIKVDSEIITKLPMPKNELYSHISPATYYRLLISDILPDYVDKVIYLDCDIIVRGSLDELWNTEISNFAIGAVYQMYNEVEDALRLGYPIEFGYFNAGVLLVNLNFWRENRIPEKLLKYLTLNYEKIVMHDQDALNAILFDKTLKLPCKWNMLHYFFLHYSRNVNATYEGLLINNYTDYKSQLKIYRKKPIVIHYVFKPKPWEKKCLHPFIRDYYIYAKATNNYCNLVEPNWVLTKVKIIFHDLMIWFKWIMLSIYNFIIRRK